MNELTLQILAEDIRTTDYYDADNCAITRALARAGREDLKDSGTIIYRTTEEHFMGCENSSYFDLIDKVQGMYFGPLKPKDFTHTLTY